MHDYHEWSPIHLVEILRYPFFNVVAITCNSLGIDDCWPGAFLVFKSS